MTCTVHEAEITGHLCSSTFYHILLTLSTSDCMLVSTKEHGDKYNQPVRMALSVKKKRSFAYLQQSHAKMCIQDQFNKNMATTPISWPLPMRAIGAQNLLTMPGGVTTSGYLHKKGGSQFSLMKWPLRFIIIHKGCVYYFKSSTSATPQGAFSLSGYNRVLRAAEETTSSNVFPFKIVHFSKRHRTWYFSAASEDERRKWMRHLRKEIDLYNDQRELQIPSDDLDAESIYGPLEEPVEIRHFEDDPEADYMTQDEDSDGEDYLKVDEPPMPPGRPMVPPPPYPPPPVPHLSRENRQTKGPPPPLPPPFKKPPSCISVNKGPPPPLPYAPHLQKPDMPLSIRGGPMPPLPPTPGSFSTMPICEKKPTTSIIGNNPATLPIVENLQKVLLKPGIKPFTSSHHLGGRSTTENRPVSPHPGSPLGNKTQLAQIPKPPLPAKPKPSRPSLERASPDGQSFRSSLEENPLKKRVPESNSSDSEDEDYENVQLPPSVFVDTTETSNVERLFKETYSSPKNGLYCIRKSGTGKTSQVLVVWDMTINKARNYRLFEEEHRVYLETDLTFPTLAALVEHYYINALPSSNNSLPSSTLCLQIPYGYYPPR